MVGSDDEKLSLYSEIKQIEKELNNKTKLSIKLNAFIISPTEYEDLKWKESKEELINKNILFLSDGPEFLNQLFKKIA